MCLLTADGRGHCRKPPTPQLLPERYPSVAALVVDPGSREQSRNHHPAPFATSYNMLLTEFILSPRNQGEVPFIISHRCAASHSTPSQQRLLGLRELVSEMNRWPLKRSGSLCSPPMLNPTRRPSLCCDKENKTQTDFFGFKPVPLVQKNDLLCGCECVFWCTLPRQNESQQAAFLSPLLTAVYF